MLTLIISCLYKVPLTVGFGPDVGLRLVATLFLEPFRRDALVEVGLVEVDLSLVLHVEFRDELVLRRMTAFVIGYALVFVYYLFVGLFLQHCLKQFL